MYVLSRNMKNIEFFFYLKIFIFFFFFFFFVVKFSVYYYLNRHVFVMSTGLVRKDVM